MKLQQDYASQKSLMKDNTIIEEAIRLVEEGHDVTLPAKGKSMLPFIVGGKESILLVKPDKIRVGDVVLAWVDDYRYVVHRIISIKGEAVSLMGDGNLAGIEHCFFKDVKAKVTHVADSKGHYRNIYSKKRVIGAKCWLWLLPIRRYLLGIYRRL